MNQPQHPTLAPITVEEAKTSTWYPAKYRSEFGGPGHTGDIRGLTFEDFTAFAKALPLGQRVELINALNAHNAYELASVNTAAEAARAASPEAP